MKTKFETFLLAASSVLFSTFGCAHLDLLRPKDGTEIIESPWSAARAAAYDGHECGEILSDIEAGKHPYRISKQAQNTEPSTFDQHILMLTCRRYQRAEARRSKDHQLLLAKYPNLVELYGQIESTSTEPEKVAVVAAFAGMMLTGSWPKDEILAVTNDDHNPVKVALSYGDVDLVVGAAWALSKNISTETLKQRLAQVSGLPAEAQEAFVANYEQAVENLAGQVETMDPATRYLAADLPLTVLQEVQRQRQEHKTLWSKLDSLSMTAAAEIAAGQPSEATMQGLEAIRMSTAARCESDCFKNAEFATASRWLTALHRVAGRELDAYADGGKLIVEDGYPFRPAAMIHIAQRNLMDNSSDAEKKVAEAKKRGMSEAAARKMAGSPGPLPERIKLLRIPTRLEWNLAHKMVPFSAVVRSISRKGDKAEIAFAKEKLKRREDYDCRRTNRVSHISRSGDVSYETDCKTRTRTEIVDSYATQTFPWREVAKVRPGQKIRGARKGNAPRRSYTRLSKERGVTGEARVIEVRDSKNRLLQVRQHRVGG
jgi:hypothetical protein